MVHEIVAQNIARQGIYERQFAELLRTLKERTGRSYEHLARQVGTSGSSLHRYCSGRSLPHDFHTVHAIARACSADPEETGNLHNLWALAAATRQLVAQSRWQYCDTKSRSSTKSGSSAWCVNA